MPLLRNTSFSITNEWLFVNKIKNHRESHNTCALQAHLVGKMVQGIKKNSPLNVIESFHLCNSSLPPCLAHDLFEGFIQKDLLYAIKYFISRQWFQIGFLNYRPANLKLSTDSSSTNCMPFIKEKYEKPCGIASQIRCLIHVLPVKIYNKIRDADDPI